MDICKKKLIPPKTDLKKLGIVTNFKNEIYKYPKPQPNVNFKLFYGKNDEYKIKELGRGGNGVVYLVTWEKNGIDDKIVLKYPFTDPDTEPELVKKVLKGYHHHIIPYKVIYDQYKNPFIIMQQANGDIYDLLRYKPSVEFIDKMIAYYAKAVGQLWRKRIVFVDMKAENLLYQCHTTEGSAGGSAEGSTGGSVGLSSEEKADDENLGPGGLSLYFGDIGSFAAEGDEEYIYNVEPLECKKIDKNFCLFTLGLLVVSMYSLDYENPKRKRDIYIRDFYKPLEKQILEKIKNKNIQKITLRLIHPDRKYRDELTVNEAISYLV
jgi:serine/threonine protein kinase